MIRERQTMTLAKKTIVALFLSTSASMNTVADEGGVSFWLTGQFGSFAAVPGEPGWAIPANYYHASADAGGQRNFIVGGNLVAGLDANVDLVFFAPSYTFAQPVLGGQAALTLGWAAGRYRVSVDAVITGRQGDPINLSRTDTTSGGSISIRWAR